ncbi:uncharacterized protein FIBRA_02067 [Fibroporia radiculosa]|uniref:Uncharacterized protein n=1 Tax=Fibroporia radiculosa TaxID=599839 RepID=J4I8U9_9APHY|nr:uncharacterized protein FIBRA_02067 [Fibroporia radiculosa]CCM00041.1 predicted protein [Fibroporia radiculosa]
MAASPQSAQSPEFDLSECSISFSTLPHPEYPNILIHLTAKVEHPIHKTIATLSALQIVRWRCGDQFLRIMDEESQELHEFSVKLFDKNGHLKPELVDDEYHRGSGCWGREMNRGTIIYVEDVRVVTQFRHRGVGSWALKKFVRSSFVNESAFIVAWPTPIKRPADEGQWKAERCKLVKFFRKARYSNGFRRIGRTSFLAYAADPGHPSHRLPAENDVEAHDVLFVPEDPGTTSVDTADPAHHARYPLHHAIATEVISSPSFQFFRPMPTQVPQGPGIGTIIREAYTKSPSSIRARDENGLTPLHIASGLSAVGAVEALLSLPKESGVYEDLKRRDNTDGVTPLEACTAHMRSNKEFSETMLGRWQGYNANDLKIEYMLRSAAGERITDSLQEWTRKRKLGCTCGQCADGWLSPRMRCRLYHSAVFYFDTMGMETSMLSRGRHLSSIERSSLLGVDHLPPLTRMNITKRFYEQYCRVVEAVAAMFRKDAGSPDVTAVRQALTTMRGIDEFFLYGGRIEHALDLVTASARDQSPVGDSTWDDMVEEDDDESVWDGYKSMPKCANDLEFALVRERLGLDPDQPWGPYFEYEDEDEDEEGMDGDGFSDEFTDD